MHYIYSLNCTSLFCVKDKKVQWWIQVVTPLSVLSWQLQRWKDFVPQLYFCEQLKKKSGEEANKQT